MDPNAAWFLDEKKAANAKAKGQSRANKGQMEMEPDMSGSFC